MGKLTFVKSPQIANPKILGLIPLSQIRKFLWCASPEVVNPQIFMNYPQILYLEKVAIFLRTFESFKSANRLGPQIANPQRAIYGEGPQIFNH